MIVEIMNMKVRDCNILPIWDAEPEQKHMLAEINLKHTLCW